MFLSLSLLFRYCIQEENIFIIIYRVGKARLYGRSEQYPNISTQISFLTYHLVNRWIRGSIYCRNPGNQADDNLNTGSMARVPEGRQCNILHTSHKPFAKSILYIPNFKEADLEVLVTGSNSNTKA